jgi:hypothetical protein
MLLSIDIKVTLVGKPPPSDYAMARNWADSQKLLNPMLCMRPIECRGLPVFLLHSVFAQYLSLSEKALPVTHGARIALGVAKVLCDTMGDYFEDESTRRNAFIRAINPLFSRWMAAKETTSQGATATISEKGIIMVLIEVKNGKNDGDAYMQASRRYEINTEVLRDKHSDFLACGAPTFICCLNG